MQIIAKSLTVTEYFELYAEETTQPTELINGEVILSAAPAPQHQIAHTRLLRYIPNVAFDNEIGEAYSAPSDIVLGDKNVVQPDIFYVSNKNTSFHLAPNNQWTGAPDLCVEILSPTSGKRDRDEKFKLYEKFKVSEYWIVDPYLKTIEIYQLSNDQYMRFAVYDDKDTLTSSLLTDLSIDLSKVFAYPTPDELAE